MEARSTLQVPVDVLRNTSTSYLKMPRAWAVRKPFCACLLLSSGTSSFSLINVTFLRFFLFCSHLLTLAPLLYGTCTCSRLDAASISLKPLFF
ncbi:hypothetical protein M440DRAFT_242958 [Trichoderma longibrachiatum ATCC 18648]|uniref:Uncharacterized protein n=1 Tax=Trichoderma longibrachiatum ATCC 18648 TaxID=983965 RepID=A0A2T4CDJ1_TRILO|nr:hypothetical protein M440DRAFT_242958 [Trichoderma longibrachiatum ATCC 18648]